VWFDEVGWRGWLGWMDGWLFWVKGWGDYVAGWMHAWGMHGRWTRGGRGVGSERELFPLFFSLRYQF